MMMVCIGERCFRDEVIWLEVFRVRAFQAEGRADGEALRHKRECACRRTSGAGEE